MNRQGKPAYFMADTFFGILSRYMRELAAGSNRKGPPNQTLWWQPFREPIRDTLLRNGAIAVMAGAVLARFWGGLAGWPMASLLVLWPSFGGHCVEVWFLNWLRPRLSGARPAQLLARIAVWFVGVSFSQC